MLLPLGLKLPVLRLLAGPLETIYSSSGPVHRRRLRKAEATHLNLDAQDQRKIDDNKAVKEQNSYASIYCMKRSRARVTIGGQCVFFQNSLRLKMLDFLK